MIPAMRLPHFVLLLSCAVFLAACASPSSRNAARNATGLFYRTLTLDDADHKYAVYLPRDYSPAKAWPCIIFLNGSGECGSDGQRQLTQGLFPAMLNAPHDWPFVALFPQKPTRASTWLEHDDLVLGILAAAQRGCNIDVRRVYLTGLSQGGAGTWAIASKHPSLFAAIAPICGFGDAASIGDSLDTMPVWAMHGEKDDVVPITQSQLLVDAVKAASGRRLDVNPMGGSSLEPGDKSDLRFTRFPDLNHGCWDRAYRDMELGEWLLSFARE
jgi:predicted peptidase